MDLKRNLPSELGARLGAQLVRLSEREVAILEVVYLPESIFKFVLQKDSYEFGQYKAHSLEVFQTGIFRPHGNNSFQRSSIVMERKTQLFIDSLVDYLNQ